MSHDLDLLRTGLRAAARAAFLDLRAALASETAYAFALYTDDDLAGIWPAANSEEALAEAVARYDFKDERDRASLRFSTGEWKSEGFGGDHFATVTDALAALTAKHAGRKAIADCRKQVLDLMVGVLGALDADGVFGSGPERERLTLLCAVTDADRSGEIYQDRSVRTLNPPAVVAAYEANRKLATGPKRPKGTPCPKCGKPLRTEKAQQCFLCGARWHGQATPG